MHCCEVKEENLCLGGGEKKAKGVVLTSLNVLPKMFTSGKVFLQEANTGSSLVLSRSIQTEKME